MKRYIDYLIRSEEHRVDEMLFCRLRIRTIYVMD